MKDFATGFGDKILPKIQGKQTNLVRVIVISSLLSFNNGINNIRQQLSQTVQNTTYASVNTRYRPNLIINRAVPS